MAPAQEFNIYDTQAGDIFRDNNPESDRIYWIVRERQEGLHGDRVILDSYDPDRNMDTDFTVLKTLEALNNGYTFYRRNSVDPLNGGRKRKRRSLKGRKSRQSKRRRVKRSRRSRRY